MFYPTIVYRLYIKVFFEEKMQPEGVLRMGDQLMRYVFEAEDAIGTIPGCPVLEERAPGPVLTVNISITFYGTIIKLLNFFKER
jgi:hypothetical protein